MAAIGTSDWAICTAPTTTRRGGGGYTSTNKVYGDTPNRLPLIELETRWEIEPGHRYADGIAIADYDNDGFPDLFVGNFGPDELYRNNGDGTFTVLARTCPVGEGAACSAPLRESAGPQGGCDRR